MFNEKKIAELEDRIKKLEGMVRVQSTTEFETVGGCVFGVPFVGSQPKKLEINKVVEAILAHLGATIKTTPASGEKLEIVTARRKK